MLRYERLRSGFLSTLFLLAVFSLPRPVLRQVALAAVPAAGSLALALREGSLVAARSSCAIQTPASLPPPAIRARTLCSDIPLVF